MITISEMKAMARKNLKRHYFMIIICCLLVGFLGLEYVSSIESIKYDASLVYQIATGTYDPDESYQTDDIYEENATNQLAITPAKNYGIADIVESYLKPVESVDRNSAGFSSDYKGPFGRTRGVFAKLVNTISSGSLQATMLAGLMSILGHGLSPVLWLIFLSLLLNLSIWIFVKQNFLVITRRIILEGRTYKKVPYQRFFFLFSLKRWFRSAIVLLVENIFIFLWCFTVVGYFIKRYSYYLVPYIQAENPSVTPLEAITLSRKMMNGYKWKCFLTELSFIGWALLSLITFGIVGIFYYHPYKSATMAEFYAECRRLALIEKVPGSEKLNDTCLYEIADEAARTAAYQNELNDYANRKEHSAALTGFTGFIANIFGIVFWITPKVKAAEEQKTMEIKQARYLASARGETYPIRLSPAIRETTRQWVKNLNYAKFYSLWNMLLLFFIFCFVGWLWEVSLGYVQSGIFVNRGFLRGPWLPIYGSGGVLILVILNKFRKYPIAEFIFAILLCGFVEYISAYAMEAANNGQKWWDYTGYFLNLHGRICAEGLLVFGIMGMVIVYLLAPLFDHYLRKIPQKTGMVIAVVLTIAFLADCSYSSKHPNTGYGITSETTELSKTAHL